MASTRPMDAKEWEAASKYVCPKSSGRAPAHMLGDVRRPLKLTGPKKAEQKVNRADRPVYDRCAAAMLAGKLFSWSIDAKSGLFLVRVEERDDWSEMMRHEVAELLDSLEVGEVAAPVKRAAKVAPVVDAPEAEVVQISSARSMSDDPVAAYLGRLVHEPKRIYAAAFAAFLEGSGAEPSDPGAKWAPKVRAKLERLIPSGAELAAAVAS